MSPLYIFAIIINGVFSTTPCKDGVEIVSTETKNPEDLLGNWTFVYHWDPEINFIKKFPDKHVDKSECLQLHFEAITPELVKAKEDECAKYKIPFNWADAKLKVDVPAFKDKASIITIGEKENWILQDCFTMAKVVIKKVSDDYIAMMMPGMNSESELIVRDPPNLDELKCVVHNVDIGKGMSGSEVC